MEQQNLVVSRLENGSFVLGTMTPFGLNPIVVFTSMEELRKFCLGILGYCNHFCPPIPAGILKAFGEEDTIYGNNAD